MGTDDTPAFEDIDYDPRGAVAELVLDRPDALNAIRDTTLDELAAACRLAETDDAVSTILLRSSTDSIFCAGGDLKLLQTIQDDPSTYEAFLERWHDVFGTLEDCAVPIVAYVDGAALAGGLELVLVCDLAVATPDAAFGDQHINLNLFPAGGSSQRLPRTVGARRAKELILTGTQVSAETAREWGLVNEVVEGSSSERLEAARAFAATVAEHHPTALGKCKRVINAGLDLPLDEGLALELETAIEHQRSDVAKAGIDEFFG